MLSLRCQWGSHADIPTGNQIHRPRAQKRDLAGSRNMGVIKMIIKASVRNRLQERMVSVNKSMTSLVIGFWGNKILSLLSSLIC